MADSLDLEDCRRCSGFNAGRIPTAPSEVVDSSRSLAVKDKVYSFEIELQMTLCDRHPEGVVYEFNGWRLRALATFYEGDPSKWQ